MKTFHQVIHCASSTTSGSEDEDEEFEVDDITSNELVHVFQEWNLNEWQKQLMNFMSSYFVITFTGYLSSDIHRGDQAFTDEQFDNIHALAQYMEGSGPPKSTFNHMH